MQSVCIIIKDYGFGFIEVDNVAFSNEHLATIYCNKHNDPNRKTRPDYKYQEVRVDDEV